MPRYKINDFFEPFANTAVEVLDNFIRTVNGSYYIRISDILLTDDF